MKKTKVLAIFFIAIISLTIICMNAKVLASEIQPRTTSEGEPVPISEDGNEYQNHEHVDVDVHNGDLYIIGKTSEYVLDRIVDGNVFFFGGNLKVTGQINGSLYAFAQTVELDENSYIACDIFAFADNVTLNGSAYDAYVACANLNMGKEVALYRDLRAFAGNIYLSGNIGRNAILYADRIEANQEEQGLSIRGNLTYEATEEIEKLNENSVIGETKFVLANNNQSDENEIWDYVWSVVGTIAFNVILYIILKFMAPKFVEKSKEYVSTKSLLAFGVGVAFIIAVPMLALLLLLTIIGVRIIFLNSIYIWSSFNVKCFGCCNCYK